MLRFWLLAGANLRRERTQCVLLVVLVLLAALVLNLWLMLGMDYHANFDRYHEALNAEDVLVMLAAPAEQAAPAAERILSKMPDVADSDITGVTLLDVSLPYNDGVVTDTMVVMEKDAAFQRRIGKMEITEEGSGKGLYFPMAFGTGDVQPGNDITVTAGGKDVRVPVAGLTNSIMAGSQNCGIVELAVSPDLYEELRTDGIPGTLISVRTQDREDSRQTAADLVVALENEFPGAVAASNSYDSVRQSRYVLQSISAAVLGAAAFFVLMVAVVVTASNTANQIQRSMPELGLLKGLGYTGRDLVRSTLLQYTILSLPAGVAGAALAYTVFGQLCDVMTSQTGIPYTVRFLPVPFIAAACISCAAVAAAAIFAARRIRRVTPIMALRTGIPTHSFRKSRFPLVSSRGSRNTAMALQACASFGRQNIIICASMAVLSLLLVFAAVMVRNVVVDSAPIVELLGVESADALLTVDAGAEDALVEVLNNDSRVERAYLYNQERDVPESGGTPVAVIVVDSVDDLNNKSILAEGRFPKYENEAALGAKHAKERGLAIGDTLKLGAGDAQSYLITGLTQGSNYLGDEAFLTREGRERIGDIAAVSYYVMLDGAEPESVIEDVRRELGESVLAGVDVNAVISGNVRTYVDAMRLIVYALVALTAVIASLVLVLLSRTNLTARWHEYGVLKAAGYTTHDLVAQTVLSFAFPLAVSILLGIIIWSPLMNPIISLFLQGVGTVRSSLLIPGGLIAVGGAGLFAAALLVVWLMARRIRKVSAVDLLRGE